ncbi:hypothetical protein EON65_01915 [archaeon]|nr:MAG: hypothetical protein EON65_01915 [archaeon]
MPHFEQLILSAPIGFVNICQKLNALAESKEEVLNKHTSAAWLLATDNCTNSEDEVKAIAFIVKSMKQAQPACSLSQTAIILASNTVLTKDCIEKILLKVKEYSTTKTDKSEQALHGRLKNLKWRIGVALSSNTCRNLLAPYVNLSFEVTNSEGKPSPVCLELTYEQFKVGSSIIYYKIIFVFTHFSLFRRSLKQLSRRWAR